MVEVVDQEVRMPDTWCTSPVTGIDLFWLPLGAGGHVVRWNGRVYEALSARLHHRAGSDLYHSALRVTLPPDTFVIEMTPVWNVPDPDRGVVAEGSVGSSAAGRWRAFRYEVHCWRGGRIPDVAEAVAGPHHLTSDEHTCRRLLAALPRVPMPVWGRDELHTGEMWNSNSLTSWALESSGLDATTIAPPRGGRAPGWSAGIVVSRRGRGGLSANPAPRSSVIGTKVISASG